MTEIVILTGASRGLGAAMAEQLLSPSRRLICIARGDNPGLAERARALSAPLEYLRYDLSQAGATDEAARRIGQVLREAVSPPGTVAPREVLPSRGDSPGAASRPDVSCCVLINNAGMVEPIAQAADVPAAEAAVTFNLNVLAVMALTSAFLTATQGSGVERRILNISSGAGRHPIPGWSIYCSTKAALDMYTRCVKAEQAAGGEPVRICSLAPGIVDTEMQSVIRGSSQAQLPEVERFRRLKSDGLLSDPATVAQRILGYLGRADFGEREVDDIRDH